MSLELYGKERVNQRCYHVDARQFCLLPGPVGRNLEGDVAMRSPAAIYTYSRTKGLFAGISIEGSALIERKEANKKWVTSRDINSTAKYYGIQYFISCQRWALFALIRRFYGRDDIRAWHMLGGTVEQPSDCRELYEVTAQLSSVASSHIHVLGYINVSNVSNISSNL